MQVKRTVWGIISGSRDFWKRQADIGCCSYGKVGDQGGADKEDGGVVFRIDFEKAYDYEWNCLDSEVCRNS